MLSFSLTGSGTSYLPFVQGTITVKTYDDTGPCSETVQALFTRLAPFNEVKG